MPPIITNWAFIIWQAYSSEQNQHDFLELQLQKHPTAQLEPVNPKVWQKHSVSDWPAAALWFSTWVRPGVEHCCVKKQPLEEAVVNLSGPILSTDWSRSSESRASASLWQGRGVFLLVYKRPMDMVKKMQQGAGEVPQHHRCSCNCLALTTLNLLPPSFLGYAFYSGLVTPKSWNQAWNLLLQELSVLWKRSEVDN